MEEKDYSFFSENDPKNGQNNPVNEESTPVNEESLAAPIQEDYSSEPIKKKRKKKTWILAVALISVFALLAGVAAFLFVPITLVDPVENTFEAMFFDTSELRSLLNTYEKKGEKGEMEIEVPTEVSGLAQKISIKLDYLTVGKGANAKTETTLTIASNVKNSAPTYKIYVDDETVALAGLLQDKDEYVSLPRKDIEKQAEGSVFNPEGDSTYKLSQKDYEELVSLLKLLSTDSSSEDTALNAALERIFAVIEEELEVETAIAFAEEGIALSKTETYSLDSRSINEILTTVIDEAKDNKALDELITFTDENGNRQTLSEKCKLLKKHAEEQKPTYTLSYTVEKGRFTEISLTLKAKNEWEKNTTNELVVEFLYDEDDLGFDFEMKETVEKKDRDSVRVEKGTYRKEVASKKTTATLKTESNYLIAGKSVPTEKGSSEMTFTYKVSGDWLLEISDSESEDDAELSGVFEMDAKEGFFKLTWDEFSKGKKKVNANLITLSVETPDKDDKVTAPDHKNLLEMDEKAFEDFFQSIRLQKPINVVDNWLGVPLLESLVPMTLEGAPIWDTEDLVDEATDYYTAYMNWGNSTRVYVYYEKYDVYVLMSRDSVDFAYELTDQQKNIFRKAEVKNGTIRLPK